MTALVLFVWKCSCGEESYFEYPDENIAVVAARAHAKLCVPPGGTRRTMIGRIVVEVAPGAPSLGPTDGVEPRRDGRW